MSQFDRMALKASADSPRYKNDPQIIAMTSLVSAYQARDVQQAERILSGEQPTPSSSVRIADIIANRSTIGADPFIQTFITDLLRSLRTQYIMDIIKPYTRMELSYLAKMLNVTRQEAEGLVVNLILDGKIAGRIDQVEGLLVLDRLYVSLGTRGVPDADTDSGAEERRRYAAMDVLTRELQNLSHQVIARKVPRGEDRGGGLPFSQFPSLEVQ